MNTYVNKKKIAEIAQKSLILISIVVPDACCVAHKDWSNFSFISMIVHLFCPTDQGPEHQGSGPEGEVQAAQLEESEGLCWCHPALPSGLQTQGLHGPPDKPEVS